MAKSVKKFGVAQIEKQKFHQNKRSISIKNIDINKIVVSYKTFFSKKDLKYFISYKDVEKLMY